MGPLLYDRLSHDDSIRLLNFIPGDSSSQIACKLSEVRLTAKLPEYQALSYTWGAPTQAALEPGMTDDRNVPILCDGQEILVTQNLHDCLLRLVRLPQLPGGFWIDEICINQSDFAERDKQVMLMADIYRNATQVMAWVGEEDESSATALKLARAIADCERTFYVLPPPYFLREEEAPGPVLDNLKNWKFLASFFQRYWFTRLWVLQEVVLAKVVTVLCGKDSVSWEVLAAASHYLATSAWSSHPFFKASDGPVSNYSMPAALEAIRRSRIEPGSELFLYSLIRSRRYKSRDPRDKIYGILGMADLVRHGTVIDPRLMPSYENKSVATTYVDAAAYILEASDDLLLLSHSEGCGARSCPSLPTWVPDWATTRSLGLGVTGYKRFGAAGDLQQKAIVNQEPGDPKPTLKIRAMKVDIVSRLGPSKRNITDGLGVAKLLRLLVNEEADGGGACEFHGCRHGVDDDLFDALWRTLLTDTASVPPTTPCRAQIVDAFERWLMHMCLTTSDGSQETQENSGASSIDHSLKGDRAIAAAEHLHSILIGMREKSVVRSKVWLLHERLKEWHSTTEAERERVHENITADAESFNVPFAHARWLKIFRTTSGHLGLAPEAVSSGDSIWLVPGSPVPLTLRPQTEAGRFAVVGGTYLHGLMRRNESVIKQSALVDITLI